MTETRLVWLALGMLGLPPHRPATPVALATVAARAGAAVPAGTDAARMLDGVATLDRAGRGDISACRDDSMLEDLRATRAGACFVCAHHLPAVPEGTIALVTATPQLALRQVAALIHDAALTHVAGRANLPEAGGIDPSALVHRDARLEPDVTIAAGAIVGPRAEIGSWARIGAHATIGADVRVGRGAIIDAHASLSAALLGDRVVVQTGARIGEAENAWSLASPAALGRVILQDDVVIGANAVVPRGDLEDTVIGEGSWIEALTFVPAGTRVDRFALIRRGERPAE